MPICPGLLRVGRGFPFSVAPVLLVWINRTILGMATLLQRTKLPDDITRYNTSAKPAVAAQPAAKLITGDAVTTQPAAAQQPSPGQQAQAAPKPAPTWRQGNSVSNGYQQDRASELYQRGMSSTNAARQAASDTRRVNAMWKNAPKVDEKSLSTWGKDSTGKFRMLKAGSATLGGVTAPTTAPKAAAVKVTASTARPAATMPQVAPSPTKMAAPAQRMRSSVAAPVARPAVNPMQSPTKQAAPGERFRSPMAPAAPQVTKPPVKAAAVSVKPAVALPSKRGLQDRMTSNFMGPNAKKVPVRKSMHRPVAGKPLAPSQPAPVAGFWRTLGNIISPTDPNRFDIPESDRPGFRRVGK